MYLCRWLRENWAALSVREMLVSYNFWMSRSFLYPARPSLLLLRPTCTSPCILHVPLSSSSLPSVPISAHRPLSAGGYSTLHRVASLSLPHLHRPHISTTRPVTASAAPPRRCMYPRIDSRRRHTKAARVLRRYPLDHLRDYFGEEARSPLAPPFPPRAALIASLIASRVAALIPRAALIASRALSREPVAFAPREGLQVSQSLSLSGARSR